jgi:hypothetical protein
MPEGYVTPQVPYAKDITLGEGIIYKHFGEGGSEEEFTHSAGGIEYVEECVYIDPLVDGLYGPVRGLKRTNTKVPRFNINAGKLTYDNLFTGIPHTQTDMGDYYSTRLNLSIAASDIVDNLTYVGTTHSGEAVQIKIENVLNDGPIEMEFKEKTEIICKMQYTGFSADGVTIPSTIKKYDV